MKNKKFISIIWWYHKQIFSFDKEQNYHMLPIEAMKEEWYECEIYAIDSQVKIENDPNFIKWTTVNYYKNIFEYIYYLAKNRRNIIYSNSLTIKTLLVWLFWKKTVFMAHDQVLPLESKKAKKIIVQLFYKFFSKIRCINSAEYSLLKQNNLHAEVVPLSIWKSFYTDWSENRAGWLFIWNLYYDKNPEILLDVCKILKEKWKQFKIIILWEDRYENNWKNFQDIINEYKLSDYFKLEWFVPHENIKKYLNKTFLYINTSISEWQCLAAYEAGLSGNALCLQNILSFPSVFNDYAKYHNNAEELALNIIDYLDNHGEAQDAIKHNQKMILQECNFQEIKEKTKKLFLTL